MERVDNPMVIDEIALPFELIFDECVMCGDDLEDDDTYDDGFGCYCSNCLLDKYRIVD
ncbi:hypothetical protein UFOVP103_21 [uncultured Caudovirales phage]|uniref:Uncharacterized protein n=1 Tax=uncultured Caudovirales phage TaxID=2100421 RepID=A0A6J7WL91_9CAUD|nr:hypothetical protein UFOVP103_21 [uncultured Caudovirales phage]CAB5216996.1 hypothetical protein UFOVP197_34 [uncultured Caudovirales phage]